MWFWKHSKKSPVVISKDDHAKLKDEDKKHFVPARKESVVTHTYVEHDDGNFGLSLAMGMATDNVGLGYIAGGSLSGALIGEALAENSKQDQQQFGGFGGGDSNGGGAGGDYSAPVQDSAPAYESPAADYSAPDSSMSDSTSFSSPDFGN